MIVKYKDRIYSYFDFTTLKPISLNFKFYELSKDDSQLFYSITHNFNSVSDFFNTLYKIIALYKPKIIEVESLSPIRLSFVLSFRKIILVQEVNNEK